MIRFILETTTRDQGHVYVSLSTVDAECPELEGQLRRGGYGSGPNGDDFEYWKVIGAERK